MCLITVFTPAFNRAALLKRVYKSLQQQTYKNFEWIIVDDGSTDNTKQVVDEFINENVLSIKYFKKGNEGKHIAINKGVENAKGQLFFIVDSDDYLTDNATALISEYYFKINENSKIAGVSFRRGYNLTKYIGSDYFESMECSVFEFRYKFKIIGDMAEVYKTNVLKKYPFPKFENEKFCPESLIWDRIGLEYKMLWTSHIIYIGEYLIGGLSDRIFEVRKKSPIATTMCYSELAKASIPFKQKFRATINYWRFAFYLKQTFFQKLKQVNFGTSIFAFPIAFLMFLNDKRK